MRQETAYAINALIKVDAVRPSYDWMLSALTDPTVERLGRLPPTRDVPAGHCSVRGERWLDANRIVAVLAMMCIHHGKNVPDLTAEILLPCMSAMPDRRPRLASRRRDRGAVMQAVLRAGSVFRRRRPQKA